MAIKELQTRIALKYDSYYNWTEGSGKNLVLLAGELGICEIPTVNSDSNVAPTVLFKVGGAKYSEGHEKAGQLMAFKDLPWASARAADVYDWAKAKDVMLTETTVDGSTTRKLEFKAVDGTVIKSITLNYCTIEEVRAIVDSIEDRVEALESKLTGSGDGSIGYTLAELTGRLNTLEGDEDTSGSVANAVKISNTYTDTAIGTKAVGTEGSEGYKAATGIHKEIADAIATTKAYADNLADSIDDKNEAQDAAINTEVANREAADKAINDKIGDGFDTSDNTVAKKVAAAAALGQQGIDAAGQVAIDLATLTSDVVASNTDNIEALQATVKDLADADDALDERLKDVEAFFKTAEDQTLDKALDTLVEIQAYLNGEGNATEGMIGRLAAAEKDIDDLEGAISDAEDNIEANAAAIKTLQELTSDYSGKGAIKTAIEEVATAAGAADEKAAAAQEAANKAQGDVNSLTDIVGNEGSGLIKLVNEVKETAEAATDSLEALTGDTGRITTVENKISTLESIINSGENKTIRDDITSLQSLTGDAAKGNEALYSEITRVAGLVDDPTTGLANTYSIATSTEDRVEAIEADYLKSADMFIFNCGSSTTNIHEKSAD